MANKELHPEIGQRIKELRELRGMEQIELAWELGYKSQSTEQVSSSSKVSTSSTSSSDVLQGRSAYDVFVENFKAWVHGVDPKASVNSTEKDIAITISDTLTDEQIKQAQPMVDGMLKIKQSGENELRQYDPNFKAPNLIVLDANAKVIAQEQNGKMVLDK